MNGDLEGLDLNQLLNLLEPAPEPVPVSWMPQTAGWIWLGLFVALLLCLGIRQVIRHRRANAYRRAGLAALKAAGNDPARIAMVIRRTVLAGFARRQVAGQTGEAWLNFLDVTMVGEGFAKGPGRILIIAPYQSPEQISAPSPALVDLARRWISNHSIPKTKSEARTEAEPR